MERFYRCNLFSLERFNTVSNSTNMTVFHLDFYNFHTWNRSLYVHTNMGVRPSQSHLELLFSLIPGFHGGLRKKRRHIGRSTALFHTRTGFLPFDLPFAHCHIRMEGGEIAFAHGGGVAALRVIVDVRYAVQSASEGESQVGCSAGRLPPNCGRDGREGALSLVVAVVGMLAVDDECGIGEEGIGGECRLGGAFAGGRWTIRAVSRDSALVQRRVHGRGF
mmetsp:Transcript_10037/g.18332  ORF Transcript_10037/g.18332 Transcript_10037/m.18332 type:complete len:220 (+) Transcript_10037:94-753(+)